MRRRIEEAMEARVVRYGLALPVGHPMRVAVTEWFAALLARVGSSGWRVGVEMDITDRTARRLLAVYAECVAEDVAAGIKKARPIPSHPVYTWCDCDSCAAGKERVA